MKLVFASNFFNHHQKPISDALAQMDGIEYHFLSFSPMPDERKNMGYDDHSDPSYVIKAYESKEALRHCLRLIKEADAVILGSAPPRYLLNRIWSNKLVLYYSERPLKKGKQILKYIPRWLLWHIRYPNHKKIYLLCASAYTAGDFVKFGLFKNKTYKWGYFPETIHYDSMEELIDQKEKNHILWCGRFLDWKHPDDALIVAKNLRDEGYSFRMSFIGGGEMDEQLRRMATEYQLEEYVQFLGTMPPENVRKYMEKAGIFLFTSDRKEGWGAVLNEAMNSGCAVVGSDEIGSVPYLIQDRNNGLVYESGNTDMLYEKTKYLLENPGCQKKIGIGAYKTMQATWNSEVASHRLLALIRALLADEKNPLCFDEGPCSKAD